MNDKDAPRASSAQPADPSQGGDSQDERRYVVRVAPAVLATIVRRAVEQVEGVLRLAESTPGPAGWKGRSAYARDGLRLALHDGKARVVVHLVIGRDYNLQTVGATVQEAVASALENLVGMQAETIDVFVQDVA